MVRVLSSPPHPSAYTSCYACLTLAVFGCRPPQWTWREPTIPWNMVLGLRTPQPSAAAACIGAAPDVCRAYITRR